MSGRTIAEYGFWKSPITADLVAGESIRIGEPVLDGDAIYWLEGRPAEGGRSVLVRLGKDGIPRDQLPDPWTVRSAVHEYGGGAYTVCDGAVYFSSGFDHRLYRSAPGEDPQPLTPDGPWRYADFEADRRRDRLVAVGEDHSIAEAEPSNLLVTVDIHGGINPVRPLVWGADFYSNPRVSPDGTRVCWLQWQHPNMPWDGTELWLGEFGPDGEICSSERVAGGSSESIFQPQWSPRGVLHFASDRSGFWNLYRYDGDCAPLHEREAEFGLPHWVFRMSTYGFADDGRIVSAFCENGRWSLGMLDGRGGLEPIETQSTQIDAVAVAGSEVVFRAASPTEPPALVRLDLGSGQRETLKSSASLSAELRSYLSPPRPIVIRSTGDREVHAFLYQPGNPDFAAPPDEKPPLIIRLHGGPTAAASDALSLTVQFWTSRGFAVADLNYGGSTGYGRAYRERLNGQWGVVDVEDTVAAARDLVEQGLADGERVIVKGGSAGGYTVLCCLAFRDVFAAGASYYGISELAGLAETTHKFESRYHETLVGKWPAEEALFAERSPLGSAERVTAPTVFFQGSADPVVPKEQTEAMVAALRARGVPVAYYLFEGEAHGFRQGQHIRQALDGELAFYATMLLRSGIRF